MDLIAPNSQNWHLQYNMAMRVVSNLLSTVFRSKYAENMDKGKAAAILADGRIGLANSTRPCHGVVMDSGDVGEFGRIMTRGLFNDLTHVSSRLGTPVPGEDYYVIDNSGGIGPRDEVPWDGTYTNPVSSGRYVGKLAAHRNQTYLLVDPRPHKAFFSMCVLVGTCTGATGVVQGAAEEFGAALGPAWMPQCIRMTPGWQGVVMPRSGYIMAVSLSTPYIGMIGGNPFYPTLPSTVFKADACINSVTTGDPVLAYANSSHESWQRQTKRFRPGEHSFSPGDRVGMMFTETSAWAPSNNDGDPYYSGRHDLLGAVYVQFGDPVNENL